MLPNGVMISELKRFVRHQLTRNQGGLHFVEKPLESLQRRPLLKRFVRLQMTRNH